MAQKTSLQKRYSDKSKMTGFLFSPFKEDKNFQRVIIQSDINTDSRHLPELNFADEKGPAVVHNKYLEHKQVSKEEYKKLVKKIKANIEKGRFSKVVAARIIKKKRPGGFNAVNFFEKLCAAYSGAFVSLVYTPQSGVWAGASPEILLEMDKQGMKTYSLAGTQPVSKNGAQKWSRKEREEQQLISEYIQASLKKVTSSEPVMTGPETMKAGNVSHLLTTFVYNGIEFEKWPQIAGRLHPTPAVAGLPKKEAIDFILKNEKAARGFYAGYLGPVSNIKVNLFVNLRCMQIGDKYLSLHVGSGITEGSKPTDEWKETQLKAQTLLDILNS